MVDVSFYQVVFPVLSLMPFCALLVVCLILKYGQICPGQHSRIQGELITIWTVLFVALMMGIETSISPWVLAIGGLGGVYGVLLSIWQGKLPNKRAIPDKAIYYSLLPLGFFSIGVLAAQQSPFIILPMIITGFILANLLLVKAKHRLEAFNKILPFAGVACSILLLIVVASLVFITGEQGLTDKITSNLYWFIGFLLMGLALWLLPVVSDNPQSHTLLGVATFLILISQVLIYEVIVLLT
ncbi:hypothetical protein [Psychrobium sp. 1_MG-2023]|uniref:hypothetical protein n=1 Tax=Psychrobium sp. 1_MG-2023 TaxID=3062624 RepID=UPI000C34C5EB|nr:hypothetical protein [Psychrobium sp. 1_MG-2023]MDP2561711.1 hypothetical protein [Psychrobium sp. 1_MG-2023]PKF57112.1 hypothetical protein CW748_08475 [Alteromonadales bacterium alter-6D02]